MEAAASTTAGDTENKKLQDVFLEGWKLYEFLEECDLEFNGAEYQGKVVMAMEDLELATRMVSQLGIFSTNEVIDEIATNHLQYLLLPYLLGKLVLQRNDPERGEILKIAEIYFRDFLQRCHEYDLCDLPKEPDNSIDADSDPTNNTNDAIQMLVKAATYRSYKIAQYKRKKELDEFVKLMRDNVRRQIVDEEVKREFYIKLIKKSIIEAVEEIESVKMEKNIVEMREAHIAEFGTAKVDDIGDTVPEQQHNKRQVINSHHRRNATKIKPLQPFIITRDATQKAIFGLGYPSVPVMTVDEFYKQRVEEGVFPNQQQVAAMNKGQAENQAAASDPTEKEEEEKAVAEEQIENDDAEYLQRMRNMDEYKDVVRRGDGNRYNRS